MNIEVTVTGVDLNSEITDRYDSEDGHKRTIADEVAWQLARRVIDSKDVWPPFKEAVLAIREDEIRKAVAPLIAEALTKPLQQTNSFGELTGPPTTLSDIIVAEARRQLAGRDASQRHSPDGNKSIVQKLVEEETSKAFREVVTAEVAKARDLVAEDIGKYIGQAVKAGLAKR